MAVAERLCAGCWVARRRVASSREDAEGCAVDDCVRWDDDLGGGMGPLPMDVAVGVVADAVAVDVDAGVLADAPLLGRRAVERRAEPGAEAATGEGCW